MNGPCFIPAPRCGYVGKGVGLHHLLGRDAAGGYLPPELFIPLCQPDDHQAGIHRLLGLEALDGPMPTTPGVLVGRIAVTLRWLTWDTPPPEPGAVLATRPLLVRAVAEQLLRISRDLRRSEGGCR